MSQATPSTPAPAPKRRRRWPYFLGGAIVLLLIVVLLVPWILSTGPMRGWILGKVNRNLNGQVDIDSWSLGWFSGISADNVRVMDDQGRVVLSVKHLETQMSALDAIKGNYALGQTIIDEPDLTHCVVYPDGSTNYQRIFSGQKKEESQQTPSAAPAKTEAPQPAAAENKPASKLPDVHGDIVVKNLQGEIIKQLDSNRSVTIAIAPSNAEIKIPSINSPIDNTLDLNLAVNGGQQGKISANGTIAAVANSELLPTNKITMDQKLRIANVDIAALSAFVNGIETTGIADGDFAIKSQGADGSANGGIVIANFTATGPSLNGDTVKSSKVTIPVQITRTGNVITINSARVQSDLGTLEAAGQFDPEALTNLQEKKAPGSQGNLHLGLNVDDLKTVASQLHNTLNLQKGVDVTGGKLVGAIDLTFAANQAGAKEHLELTDLRGNNNGRAVALSNIVNDGSATILPGNDLRDLALALSSAFANLKGGGPSVANLTFNGDFDLAKLQQEVGQFVDLSQAKLAGTGTFDLKTQGDLASVIKTQLNATLDNVNFAMPNKPAIAQDHLQLALAGNLDSNKKLFNQATIGVTSASLNVAATGDVNYGNNTLPAFDISKLDLPNLPQAQKEFGGFIPSLQKNNVQVTSGSLSATLAGSYDGKTLKLTKPLNAVLNGVTLNRGTAQVLNNETMNLTAAGTVSQDGGMSADFTNLAVTSSSHLLDLHTRENAPLLVAFTSNGGFTGKGAVDVGADVKRLYDLGSSMGMIAKNDQLQGGRLDGSIEFTQAKPTDPTQLNGTMNLTQVTVRNYLNNETVKLTFNSTISPNMQDITGKLGLTSSFATADVTNVALTGGSLKSADATLNVPDLPKLYALGKTMVPSTQPSARSIDIARGSMTAKLSIAQKDNATNLNLSEARISGLQLNSVTTAKNQSSQTPSTWTAPSDIVLTAVGSLSQAQKTLKIDQLTGNLAVAQLQMPQLINVSWGKNLSATGAVTLNGQLADLTNLMQVLGGTSYPYTGAYTLNETFSTPSAGNIGLKGGATVNNFQVVNNGKTEFSEAQLAMANDVVVNQSDVAINSLTVDMKSSGALKLAASGTVQDYANKRVIPTDKPLKLDLDYDLGKLQPIVKPMVAPNPDDTLADLQMSGTSHVTYNVRGTLSAIKTIVADGALDVPKLSTNGITIEKLHRPLTLKDGIFSTGSDPATATANGGTLDLSNLQLDLTQSIPRLTTPDNKKVMSNVQVGPIMAAKALKTIPIFGEGANASTMDLTIAKCTALAMNSAIKTPQSGYAKLLLNVNNVQPGGPLVSQVTQLFSFGGQGQIQNATIEINNGVINQNTQVTMGQGQQQTGLISLQGGINLASMTYQNFTFTLPSSLLTHFDKNLAKYLPQGIALPVTGSVSHPNVKADQVVSKLVTDAGQKALLGNITGQGQNAQPGQGQQGGVGGLLNQLGQQLGGKKKKNK